MKKIVFFCICLILFVSSAFADTITLKSGKQVEGKILEKTAESVKIDFQGVELTYFLDEIDSINEEKIMPAVEAGETKPVLQEEISVKEATELNLTEPLQTPDVPVGVENEPSARVTSLDKGSKQKMLAAGVALVVIIFVLILILIGYIYFCLCLQFIAKKTNTEPAWLAWVPIGSLFLMCKIGKINYLWLLCILLSFIPIIGILFGLAFSGFIWYKIALARNKPAWLGILAVIPIVSLIIMGYLAFSD